VENLCRILAELGRAHAALVECGRGHRIYLVGGAVRDALMGRTPTDFDFAVAGSGIDFARDFSRRCRAKLVILSEPDDEARVVWHREFTFDFNGFADRTIEDDVRRRDFTINALACELTEGRPGPLLDLVAGQADIERRIVRPVGPDSFRSDPLRLLRGLRLALELGFTLDRAVFEQGRTVSLSATAPERIGSELLRIMEADDSYPLLRELHAIGRLQEILPELGPLFADDQLREHSFRTYQKIEGILRGPTFFHQWGAQEPDETPADSSPDHSTAAPLDHSPLPFRRSLLKLSGLLHDIAKPETRFTNTDGEVHFYGHDSLGARIVRGLCRDRLRLSRSQTDMLTTLTAEHMRLHLLATSRDLTDRAIRRYFHDLGDEALGLMILCVADGWATAGRTLHLEETISRMVEQKRAEDARARIKRLVSGDDLIALGMTPGPAFKVILQELEDLQIEGRINSKEDGLEYLKTHLPALTRND
jgi:tRNA nucleotidyltransferase/poly(A) polymerase